jgi:hypothetical protein
MSSKIVEDEVNRIFDERDYRNFRWVFCRSICEHRNEPVTDYQLFLRSGLKAYMGDEKLMKDYVLDNAGNVYKVFVDRVLKSLIDRNLLREVKEKYGGIEMVSYESTDLMREKNSQFTKYLMSDVDMVLRDEVN